MQGVVTTSIKAPWKFRYKGSTLHEMEQHYSDIKIQKPTILVEFVAGESS